MNRTSTLKSRLRLAFLAFFLAVGLLVNPRFLLAQPDRHVVFHYETYLNILLSSEDPDSVAKGEHLKHLVDGIMPVGFVQSESNEIYKPLGGEYTVLMVSEVKMGTIQSSVPGNKRNQLELISITLDSPAGMSKRINPTGLRGFGNLQYLMFTFCFPLCEDSDPSCEVERVKSLLLPPGNSRIVILYRVAKPI